MTGKVSECRICGSSDFRPILDLGHVPPVDSFLEDEELEQPEKSYPLKLIICENCKLVQLSYVVPKEELFNSNYAYDMSVTDAGVEHFYKMAAEIDETYSDHSIVLDIGSNTGVLLEGFKKKGWDILGVEPSSNVYMKAKERGIPTKNDFFSEELAERILNEEGKKDIVTATNVFAHVDDLHDFMRGVKTILSKDGVFIIEVPYLVDLIENNEFDTIYHEHLSYFSVKPLIELFNRHGMELVEIEPQEIHGGSLRIHVANQGEYGEAEAVETYRQREQEASIHSEETLDNFRDRVEKNRQELINLINNLSSEGKSIAGIGAPAKGVVLLNYCDFDRNTIPYVSEKSEIKIGKSIPGTHNKVVSDKALIEKNPDYALLLPWNFADSIIDNLEEYMENGGKIIIPVPEPHIIQS